MSNAKSEKVSSESVLYVRRETKPGEPLFSEMRMPNGMVIRTVDEGVHQRALKNASRRYRENLNGS